MLVFQCQLYRKRLLWKISFGAEKFVHFMECPLDDCSKIHPF